MTDRGGGTLSNASKGLSWLLGTSGAFSAGLVRATLSPLVLALTADTGVKFLDGGLLTSPMLPSRTSVSTVRSRFPFILLSTVEFLRLSGNPISRNAASLESNISSWLPLPIFDPKTRDCLFCLGEECPSEPLSEGESGGVYLSMRWCCGYVELEERKLKPNLLPGFGGRAGG